MFCSSPWREGRRFPLLKDVAERGGVRLRQLSGDGRALGAEKMIESGLCIPEKEASSPLSSRLPLEGSSSLPCSARGLYGGSPDGPFTVPFSPVCDRVGGITHWAVDLPGTVVGLQQGTRPVERDGFPPPTSTAGIDDGILKADDGFEMDWEVDRPDRDRRAVFRPSLCGSVEGRPDRFAARRPTARGTLPFVITGPPACHRWR